jgi:flagellar biosynthetic protein FliQ
MDADAAVDLVRQALLVAAVVCAPALGTALVVGLITAAAQAATQVHDGSLSVAPKIIAVALVVALLLPWLFDFLIGYGGDVIRSIPHLL